MSLNEGSIERAEVRCFATTQIDHGGTSRPDPLGKAIVSCRSALNSIPGAPETTCVRRREHHKLEGASAGQRPSSLSASEAPPYEGCGEVETALLAKKVSGP